MFKNFIDITKEGYDICKRYEIADLLFSDTCNAYRQDKMRIDEIVFYMLSRLITYSNHSPRYILIMRERITYELCLELYSELVITNKNSKTKSKDKIKHYLKRTGLDGNLATYNTRHSKSCKTLSEDLLPLYGTFSLKYSNYRTVMSEALSNSERSLSISEDDEVFYILNHNNSFYSKKHFTSGMPYNNFNDFVSDYIYLLQNGNNIITDLQYELSAFHFQKLHCGISYQNFIYNLAASVSSDKKFSAPDYALYTYIRLHDTHHLSLTDYILSTYLNGEFDFLSFDKNREQLDNAYYDFRMWDSFFLPLIKYVLAAVLYDLHNKDCEQISSLLKDYINRYQYKTGEVYTYRNLLMTAKNNIDTLHKKEKKCNDSLAKKRLEILHPIGKNDRPSYKFSCQLSNLFFKNDNQPLLLFSPIPTKADTATGTSLIKVPVSYTLNYPAYIIQHNYPEEVESAIKSLK